MCVSDIWWFIIVLIKGVWMFPWINGQEDIKGFYNIYYWVGLTDEKLEQVGFSIFFRIL